jgi:hypothetical protein
VDVYFSADVETDGPIPGPYSILSFALVFAGRFDGCRFERPRAFDLTFYRELKPISESFDAEALRVNGLDRERLISGGNRHREQDYRIEDLKVSLVSENGWPQLDHYSTCSASSPLG